MVSCKLLAHIDLKLRSVMRDIGTAKNDGRGKTRPFGGLNVVCSGDFWQLDPPDGGYLGDIPFEFIAGARRYRPSPTVSHGQALFWGGREGGMQGITELDECERCKDLWLREVQEQFREETSAKTTTLFCTVSPPAFLVVGWVAK